MEKSNQWLVQVKGAIKTSDLSGYYAATKKSWTQTHLTKHNCSSSLQDKKNNTRAIHSRAANKQQS